MGDRILLRDLSVICIIGVMPRERLIPQKVVFNISLGFDLKKAGQSDNLEDTLNYKILRDEIVRSVKSSKFLLIEKLIEHVASLCLTKPGVTDVKLSLDKPGALTGCRSVAVEIERRK